MKNRRLLIVVAAATLIAGAGCSKKAATQEQEKAALKAALETHLASRSGLNREAMDVEIKMFQVNGNQAEAEVEFRAKQAQAAMQVIYQFERAAAGQAWTVKGSRPSGGMQHPTTGDSGATPGGQPVMGLPGPAGVGAGGGQGTLPPGHPPTTNPPPKQEKQPAKNP